MDTMPLFVIVPAGMLAGMICTTFFTRWLAILFTAVGKEPGVAPSLQRRRRIGPILVAVLHPVPWLLLIGWPVGIYKLIYESPPEAWVWFFGSAVVSFVGLFVYAFLVARKRMELRRKNEAERNEQS
jgi:hypothetical protein